MIPIAPLRDCLWNWNTGLWETHPRCWASERRIKVIVIAFPWPTSLERGVMRETIDEQECTTWTAPYGVQP